VVGARGPLTLRLATRLERKKKSAGTCGTDVCRDVGHLPKGGKYRTVHGTDHGLLGGGLDHPTPQLGFAMNRKEGKGISATVQRTTYYFAENKEEGKDKPE